MFDDFKINVNYIILFQNKTIGKRMNVVLYQFMRKKNNNV
jgi:hypothetical protein